MKRSPMLLLALAACGGGGHHTNDASPYDAPSDTLQTSADASADGVTLRVTSNGQPVANVASVFLDAGGKPVAAVTTDASGNASATVGPGGSVTAVLHEGVGLDHLMTFTAVQPGDVLAIELQPRSHTPAPGITVTAPTNGSQSYSLFPSCGDSSSSLDGTFSFLPLDCDGAADFVVTSTNDMLSITGFVVATNVLIGANAVIPGTFGAPISRSYAYTDVPAMVTNIVTRAALLGHNGPMYAAESAHDVTGTSFTTTEPMPDTTGLGISALVVSNLYPQSTELGQQTILEVADSSTDYTVGITQAMLPRYITAPAYDAASRTIGWGEAPASVEGNLVRARIHAVRDGGRSWTWQIVGAKGATSITFPELPTLDGFSYVPLATDTVGVDELTTASIPGGYSGVRAHAFGDLNDLATSGRSAIETLFTPNL